MTMNVLLLGNNTQGTYHPIQAVEHQLLEILGSVFEVTVTEDTSLILQDLTSFQRILSYADIWNETLTDTQTGGLLSFVARGGGLLTVHNGISLANRSEIMSMPGAAFTRHPTSEHLIFHLSVAMKSYKISLTL